MSRGGCYCGALRYESTGAPVLAAQCHCRVCQYVSGGGPNYFMLVPEAGFAYSKGVPAQFTHPDVDGAVTRDFCGICGVHILTRLPYREDLVLKVGTLDDGADYPGPHLAIHCADQAHFHQIAEGVARYDRLPGRG